MMLYNLDARGKRNWVSNVRMQLFQYGRIGKIMFKLVTDLVCTEVLIAFRIVPKHI